MKKYDYKILGKEQIDLAKWAAIKLAAISGESYERGKYERKKFKLVDNFTGAAGELAVGIYFWGVEKAQNSFESKINGIISRNKQNGIITDDGFDYAYKYWPIDVKTSACLIGQNIDDYHLYVAKKDLRKYHILIANSIYFQAFCEYKTHNGEEKYFSEPWNYATNKVFIAGWQWGSSLTLTSLCKYQIPIRKLQPYSNLDKEISSTFPTQEALKILEKQKYL